MRIKIRLDNLYGFEFGYFLKLVILPICFFCILDILSKMPIDFKNEEEVKQYIENLGIEYRFGCFSEKKPEVCHLLGDYLDAIKRDFHKAARIYKSNCDDDNFPKSCHNYGNYLLTGQGVDKKNEEDAYKYYLKACSLGVGLSCFNVGMMTINPLPNQKREKDYIKGIEFLDKSCSLSNPNACYFLSGLYITGSQDKEQAVVKDMAKAFQYAEKACELDHLYACMNLSLMYRKGEGVEKNEEMAKKISKKVDDLNEQLKSQITIEFQRGSDSS